MSMPSAGTTSTSWKTNSPPIFTPQPPPSAVSPLPADILLQAYASGIFPMAETRAGTSLLWLDPDPRAILPLDGFHIPRRLRRRLRNHPFPITIDRAFRRTVAACAEATPPRPQTWINPQLEHLYLQLHRHGHAHSVEAWHDGQLAGGVFGVALHAAFFAESMFTRVTDAGKAAFLHLVERLRCGGFQLLDIQFTTPHLQRFGAVEISRAAYRARLARALRRDADFHALRLDNPPPSPSN